MWVALCNDPKDFIGKSFKNQVVAVPSSGEMIITFEDIPKGNYAVRLFQDVNNSGKLETGMFGIPKEPYGFSNNPTLMSQPKFKDGEFQIFGNQTIIIRLK
ncbi:MAG: DUF2141 domain-containing protein [Verrucomicrobia bacterium]|nr:DUF2141 domain-containing protein [Cytophagales bacterium]